MATKNMTAGVRTSMKRKKFRIKSFAFEEPTEGRCTCDFCGRKYKNHGIGIAFNGKHGDIDLDGIWLCGDCLLAGPEAVSERMLAYAATLKTKRKTALYEDPQSVARELEEGALTFRNIGHFSLIPGYEMAVAVATIQANDNKVA